MGEALKFDTGKPRLDLIPHRPLQEVAKVLMFGLKKYSAHNWREGTDWSRFVRAAQDHIGYWNEGQDIDPETKLSHLAHAVCCLLFLMWYQIFNVGNDDRYKEHPASIVPAYPYTPEEHAEAQKGVEEHLSAVLDEEAMREFNENEEYQSEVQEWMNAPMGRIEPAPCICPEDWQYDTHVTGCPQG